MLTINPKFKADFMDDFPVLTTFENNIYESVSFSYDEPMMYFYEYWITLNEIELEDKMFNLGFSNSNEFFMLKSVSSTQYASGPLNAWRVLVQLDNT